MVAQTDSEGSTIRAVHTLTTGHVEQHSEHRYGTSKPLMWWVLTSKSWIKAPITAYAIEHRDGLVLFDTGVNPALVSDPDYISSPIGRYILKKVFRLHIDPEDALDKQLESAGLAAADVHKVVISHLHFDHIGGIAHVPQATLLVSMDEWRQLDEPNPERDWILREHIELPGAKWQPIEFEPTSDPLLAPFGVCYDCMGDGSMILLPTPGHTRGSMSLLVRSDGIPPLLFVGDLTYELEPLHKDQLPGIGNVEQLKDSFAKVRELEKSLPGLIVVPSHDPFAAGKLVAAMEPDGTQRS